MTGPGRREFGLLAGLAVVLAVGFYGAAAAVAYFGAEYGFDPAADADRWRALAPAYAEAGLCTDCHEREGRRLASATHAGIGCESCHGGLAVHALASPGSPEASLDVADPEDAVCLTCHASTVGRPVAVRVIEPPDHYVSTCLACHDPHTGISNRPPVVEHTLERLPDCVTCHGPEGFKARDQRHPSVSDEDEYCLSCHLEGRGPEEDDE